MSEKSESTGARVLVLDAAYDESMDQAIARVMEEFPIEWNGKKVLVKPNMLAPFAPEEGVTTHPTVVRAVVRQLRDRGAEVMVGDSPGLEGYGDSDATARTCGLVDAAEGCYINLGRKAVRHPIKSKYFDHVIIGGDVLEADIVVNLPKLKTHGLTTLTGAVKNTFGYVLGGDKMRVHSRATTPRKFAEALLDIHQIKPPALNIMDAVVAMEGNGPSKGALRTVGKVLACENAVTLDAVAVHLVGQKIKAVPYVEIGGNRGMGEVDISRIRVEGDITPIKDFKLPSTFVPGFIGVFLNRFLSNWVNCVPEVIEDTCQSCGICVDHCPVDAMLMTGEYPRADLDKCINCYCCQEMCPEGAIKLTGRIIQTLRRLYNPKLYRGAAPPS